MFRRGIELGARPSGQGIQEAGPTALTFPPLLFSMHNLHVPVFQFSSCGYLSPYLIWFVAIKISKITCAATTAVAAASAATGGASKQGGGAQVATGFCGALRVQSTGLDDICHARTARRLCITHAADCNHTRVTRFSHGPRRRCRCWRGDPPTSSGSPAARRADRNDGGWPGPPRRL